MTVFIKQYRVSFGTPRLFKGGARLLFLSYTRFGLGPLWVGPPVYYQQGWALPYTTTGVGPPVYYYRGGPARITFTAYNLKMYAVSAYLYFYIIFMSYPFISYIILLCSLCQVYLFRHFSSFFNLLSNSQSFRSQRRSIMVASIKNPQLNIIKINPNKINTSIIVIALTPYV